ncbi:hypothetical protein CsSME_00050845 [Camellia sinensis var. sinensis]
MLQNSSSISRDGSKSSICYEAVTILLYDALAEIYHDGSKLYKRISFVPTNLDTWLNPESHSQFDHVVSVAMPICLEDYAVKKPRMCTILMTQNRTMVIGLVVDRVCCYETEIRRIP